MPSPKQGLRSGVEAGTIALRISSGETRWPPSLLERKILPPSITDWFTDDDDNVHEDNINRIADDGVTFGCGDMNYCPIDPVRRDQMASFLARAKGLLEVNVPPASNPKLHLISSSLDGALYATSPDGDDRLFVVEKSGTIALFKGEVETGTKFLDLRSMVSGGLEQGLFGLAFHPDYSSNGLFYVSYTDLGRRFGGGRICRRAVILTSPTRPVVE